MPGTRQKEVLHSIKGARCAGAGAGRGRPQAAVLAERIACGRTSDDAWANAYEMLNRKGVMPDDAYLALGNGQAA